MPAANELGWSGDLDAIRAEAVVLLDRLAAPLPESQDFPVPRTQSSPQA
jgi:hypothetical protein